MGSHANGRHDGLIKGSHVARKKALHAGIGLACSLLLSSGAVALELGDITLDSALNEPLSASIEIDRLGGVQADAIMVSVGTDTDYEAAGVDRDPVLDSISFDVEVTSANEGRIVVRSTGAVAEPFLNLIVMVSEPAGEIRKEYTLLLELPGQNAVTQATPPAAGQGNATQAASAASTSDSYTVGAGDTLWEIALSTRPDANVSVQQMMLAIQRANPDAFIGGNINSLISGRVLRIPSQQDIAIIDQQAAVAQVSQQNTSLGGQPLAAGGNAAGGANDTRDQLRVLSGNDAVDPGNGSSDLAATIAALENELMLSEENLDRARIENLELNNRLAALQEQIDLLENIIAMEDDRIATLQAELAQQAAATQQALASANAAAAQIEQVNSTQPSGLNGLLRSTVGLLVAGLALLALILGFLFHRRRQAQLAAEEGLYNPALADVDELQVDEEKAGLLAGLLARLRRNRDEDADDFDDYEADAFAEEEDTSVAVAQAAPAPKKDSTDRLLDEMGIEEQMTSLDDALDGIDNAAEEAPAEVFEPVADASASEAEEAEVAAAAEQSSELQQDNDYAITAASAAFATIDDDAAAAEASEFNTPAAEAAPVDVAPQAVEEAEAEVPETFEFTLKDVPEVEAAAAAEEARDAIETFDFKPASVVAAVPAVERSAEPEETQALETIAFPGTAQQQAPAIDDDLSLGLGDLSFDDTTLPDDDEEESPYKPRTGNECDTKLDLATAYEAMGDVVEAIEILDEVIAEGSPEQVETAQRLKESWQASL